MRIAKALACAILLVGRLRAADAQKLYFLSTVPRTQLNTYTPDGQPVGAPIKGDYAGFALDNSGRILLLGINQVFKLEGSSSVSHFIFPRTPLTLRSIAAGDEVHAMYTDNYLNGIVWRGGKSPLKIATGLQVPRLAVDRNGKIYALSATSSTLKIYDADGHETASFQAGRGGTSAFAVGADGRIYVASGISVMVYTPDGKGKPFNVLSSNWNGGHDSITALAVDDNGRLYVAYWYYFIVYNPDGSKAVQPVLTPRDIIAMAVR